MVFLIFPLIIFICFLRYVLVCIMNDINVASACLKYRLVGIRMRSKTTVSRRPCSHLISKLFAFERAVVMSSCFDVHKWKGHVVLLKSTFLILKFVNQSINGGVQLGVRPVLVIIRVGLNNGLLHVSAIHGETDLFYLFIFYFYFRYRKVEWPGRNFRIDLSGSFRSM